MPNIKTKKISMRIPIRLYEMVQDLLPLFGYNETAVVVHILKNYYCSVDHSKLIEKLERARYIAFHRDLTLKRKQEEWKKKGFDIIRS